MTPQSNRLDSTPQREIAHRGVGRVPTLAAAALVALFLCAAYWQHARMQGKEVLRAKLEAARAMPAIDLPQQVTDWSTWRFQPVALAGHYDSRHQILIDNRIEQGRVGYHVVTPLLLHDGRSVLVDRGFVPRGASRSDVPQPAVEAGDVVVHGRIQLPGRYLEFGTAAPEGSVWQNLDPARFAAATGIAVLPVIIEQDSQDAHDGLVRNWPPPDFGVDTNRSYMLQWIAFAVVVAGLWVGFRFFRK
ncbi:MAG: SURF1 family protein [Casimicrobiaceae bacterium]